MNDDNAEFLGKLILGIFLVSLAITIAVLFGGPLCALYTLVKGWDNVSTRVKVCAIGLPLIGAGFVAWTIAQGQVYTWDWASVLLMVSPFFSLGMVGIAYYRYQRANALPTLPLLADPMGNVERLCVQCGALNRAGYKYCGVCGKPAIGATHQRVKGP